MLSSLSNLQRYFHENSDKSKFVDRFECLPNFSSSSSLLSLSLSLLLLDSYRDMNPDEIFRQLETEKKRPYASRMLEVEQAMIALRKKNLRN